MTDKTNEERHFWSVYLIRCGDNSLYTGISNDVVKRFLDHQLNSRRCAKYLRGRHPLKLIYTIEVGDRAAASRLETQIKKLPKYKKECLVSGRYSLIDLGLMAHV